MSVKITLDEITYELHINDTDNLDYQIELSNKIHHAKLKSIDDQVIEVIIDGYYYTAFISCDLFGNTWLTYEGLVFNLKREDQLPAEFDLNSIGASSGEKSGIIKSQMPGKVVKVNVAEGDKVSEGDVIVIVESMKMENNLLAEIDGIVEAVNAETGEMVDSSKVLVKIKEDD